MDKFYRFSNNADNSIDIYVYGEIISGSTKWDESDVVFNDFKDKLENLKGNETVNIYINSHGGSLTTTQGIIAMLERAKEKGVVVNATIDGLGASCASILPLVADNVYAYNTSLMALHKPMTCICGNADDFQDGISVLDKFESSVMMPIYMSKVKTGITEGRMKELVNAETWLDAQEMTEIFDIAILKEPKELIACVSDKSIFDRYRNIPKKLMDKLAESDPKDNKKVGILKAKLLLECEI